MPSNSSDRDHFLDALLARMTLTEKIGQLNYPHSGGADATGVGGVVDARALIRAGAIAGISEGANAAERRALQAYAVEHGPNGIPLLIGKDCIQRYRTGGPIPLGLAASWDLAMIGEIAAMTAREARADGININWAPMLDISYDARWGRIAEGNGEFPWLGARIAETVVAGYQGADMARPDRMMATLKHFAGYGLAQAGRDYAAVEASAATLWRIMEPFRAGVAAGAGAVMVAFNTVNDIPATAHQALLLGVLRRRFGFAGIIVTDFTAIDPELVNHGIAADAREAAYLAFKAGVNLDLVSQAFRSHLPGLVADGARDPDAFHQAEGAYRFGPVTEAEVTARCRQVLEAKWNLGLFADPFLGFDEGRAARVTRTPADVALVRKAAAAACVLLKNDAALPLRPEARVAVIGPLADSRIDMQGTWAIDVDTSKTVTILEGMRAIGGDRISHAKGCNIVDDESLAARLNMHNMHDPSVVIDGRPKVELITEALRAAEGADAIVLCVGEAKEHSGESSTRDDVRVPLAQFGLIEAMADEAMATGRPLILLAMGGRPLVLTHEVARADAVIWVTHPGNEAGNGIADILYGKVAPTGRLPQALPRSVGQLPFRSEDLPTGRPRLGIGVDVAGDKLLDRDGRNAFRKFTTACRLEAPSSPLFPAGFGLTYTSFAHGPVTASATELEGAEARLDLALDVTNTGDRTGVEVVQLYLRDLVGRASRPVRELRGFRRVALDPGETRRVAFTVTPADLAYPFGETLEGVVVDWETGSFEAMIGPDCERVQTLRFTWRK